MAKAALEGLRVADFSWVIAGPMATKALGAMGAEIIKVESHVRAEFFHRDPLFDVVNNGKKSVALDLARPEACELAKAIVAQSDILVENFSQGVMGRWGLDYAAVRKIRPNIIYVSGSGVGREGPQSDVLAYGSLLEAFSGRANLVARGAINPRMEAMGIMPAWTDPATAMWEVFAILLAVHHRHETGEGAFIDLSMIESTIALLAQPIIAHQVAGGRNEPGINEDYGAAPSGCFRCAGDDSWIALSIASNLDWQALCEVAAWGEIARDRRYATGAARLAAKGELDARVGNWLAGSDASDVETRLCARGVCAARSRNMADIMDDPDMAATGIFQQDGLEHATTSLPWKEADGWRGIFPRAPRLGEHSGAILRELARVDDDTLIRLHQEAVLFDAGLETAGGEKPA